MNGRGAEIVFSFPSTSAKTFSRFRSQGAHYRRLLDR